ncbi:MULTISPECIES: helix-turn-helix domain-containing protein [Enterococcus]|uniref:helix-turn-helix domain-containing protein n=1 Tax=Enterococcus TaxID=1350 RepID=UPI0009B07264|nr:MULTISPECIES: helix-turn-helix domain-containing protein [Enterococcus]MDP8584452.1 helix-turn-helix domain-containing protein [Listeria innocua]MBK4858881.1 transcriptional regulator [Enterococcus faecium]NJE63733.1 helix-turn-helix domain-containing protein [Enterococcus durans]BDP45648.1 hypothetical protein EfmJHP9_05180 [Enterococcus faecium]BDP49093.1 hypothetical protein EfmJHP10_05290 [Enterococcus faecium]
MNRIQELRKEAHLTQAELAKKIGVNPVTMSRYENGNRSPKLDKLEKMSDLFHVSIDYITGKSDSRTGTNEHWDEIARKMNVGVENSLPPLARDKDIARKALLLDFDKLNESGRKEALKQVKNLSKISDYTD